MMRSLLVALVMVSAAALHAQDLQEGTWGGTLTRFNANAQRPQRQKFALEFKKAPDPHWAWRPGSNDVWTITVILQQGRSQALEFRWVGETMRFAYRREDAIVSCELAAEPDGTFAGDCLGDGDASSFRLSLTPVKATPK
jgi:hypothetical protein